MNPLSKIISSREAELVEQFPRLFSAMTANGDEVASFHSQSLLLLLQEVGENLKAMKRKKGTDDYVESERNAFYNQALSDLQTLLTEAITTLEKK